MSFLYSDLYEDSIGEHRKSNEEKSEGENLASEKVFQRRLSDQEEEDGYLEKFTLKDETPAFESQSEEEEDNGEGTRLWPQSKFEMTGCLTRMVEEKEEEHSERKEEPKREEVTEKNRHLLTVEDTETEERLVEKEEKVEETCPVIGRPAKLKGKEEKTKPATKEKKEAKEGNLVECTKEQPQKHKKYKTNSNLLDTIIDRESSECEKELLVPAQELVEATGEASSQVELAQVVKTENVSQEEAVVSGLDSSVSEISIPNQEVTKEKEEVTAIVEEKSPADVPEDLSVAEMESILKPFVELEILSGVLKPGQVEQKDLKDGTVTAPVKQKSKSVSPDIETYTETDIDAKKVADVAPLAENSKAGQEEQVPSVETEAMVQPKAVVEPELRVASEAEVQLKPRVGSESVVEKEQRVSSEAVVELEPNVGAEAVIEPEPREEPEAVVELEPRVGSEAGVEPEAGVLAGIEEAIKAISKAVVEEVVVYAQSKMTAEASEPKGGEDKVIEGTEVRVEAVLQPVGEVLINSTGPVHTDIEGNVENKTEIEGKIKTEGDTEDKEGRIENKGKIEKKIEIGEKVQETITETLHSQSAAAEIQEMEIRGMVDPKTMGLPLMHTDSPEGKITQEADKDEGATLGDQSVQSIGEKEDTVKALDLQDPLTAGAEDDRAETLAEDIKEGEEIMETVKVKGREGGKETVDVKGKEGVKEIVESEGMTTAPSVAPVLLQEQTQVRLEDYDPEVISEREDQPSAPLDTQERWPTPPTPLVEGEDQEAKQTIEGDFETNAGFLSTPMSFTPHEELSGQYIEAVCAETKLHPKAVSPETEIQQEAVSPVAEVHQMPLSPVTEIHQEAVSLVTEMQQDVVSPETEIQQEAVSPVTEIHQEAVSPVAEVHQMPLSSVTEIRQEAVSLVTEMQQEDVSPETEIQQEAVSPVAEVHQKAVSLVTEVHQETVSPVTEMHQEAVSPVTEVHQEVVSPETEVPQEAVSPVTEMQQEAESPVAEVHQRAVSPVTEVHQKAVCPVTEMHQETVSPVTEIQQEAVSPVTEVHQRAVSPVTEVHQEAMSPVTEVHQKAVSPVTEMHQETVSPVTEMHQETVSPVTEIRQGAVSPVTEVHQKAVSPVTEVHQKAVSPVTDTHQEAMSPVTEVHQETATPVMELHQEVNLLEELEYEMISQQEAREQGCLLPHSSLERRKEEMEEWKEGVLDLTPEEDLIEEDYEMFDDVEESQARAAADLEGMDWFCVGCGCLLTKEGHASGGHQAHKIISVDQAYNDERDKLNCRISELQERSENIEDLVSELELSYNTIEEQFQTREEAMQEQNEKMLAGVMEQYTNMSLGMEEEKKSKLEQLYDQIVSFQESIDTARAMLETTAREVDTDARSISDINTRLSSVLQSAMSLELGPRGLLVFEDYAKGNAANTHTHRKGIPGLSNIHRYKNPHTHTLQVHSRLLVLRQSCRCITFHVAGVPLYSNISSLCALVPQQPFLQSQEPGSASSTSVTVYWRVNPGDIIDCFQVYCIEDPHEAVSEEYRVTVKESYCVLEDLDPEKGYKVWVMAVNYTGCSLPSRRLTFRTAPPVPVIDTERCTVLWNSAVLRWSPANQMHTPMYTLEYCRQYALEGEGLRSISGIRSQEQQVQLQPDENYLFYIKAVNEAGASEQSEATLISTRGTRFRLLQESAQPGVQLSENQKTLVYRHSDTHLCPSVLGELLPAIGHYYWETVVTGSPGYRIGVAYGGTNRDSPLGENNTSWCLHCIPTPSSCRFEMLHASVQADVFVVEVPERVGTLLDYEHQCLSFYNAQTGQLLGTLTHPFILPCHPVLGIEQLGSLGLSMVLEVPEFT